MSDICAICENPRDHCTCDWRGPYPAVVVDGP
jgi:hypothetical protein